MTRFLLAASAAGLLSIAPAMAQNTQTQGTQAQGTQTQGTQAQSRRGMEQVNSQDRTFVQTAAQGNEAEIQAGQLAETRAATPAVREFGRWMVTDHTMANAMLQAVARRIGVEVPGSPTAQQTEQMSKLKNEQGASFDKTYITAQVQDHEKTVSAFQKEVSSGQNPMLKRLAQSVLPMLEQHLTEANELQQALSKNAMASTQSH